MYSDAVHRGDGSGYEFHTTALSGGSVGTGELAHPGRHRAYDANHGALPAHGLHRDHTQPAYRLP